MGRRQWLQRDFGWCQPSGPHQLDEQVALAHLAAFGKEEKSMRRLAVLFFDVEVD